MKIIDENGFFSLLRAAPEPNAPGPQAAASAPVASPAKASPAQSPSQKGKSAGAAATSYKAPVIASSSRAGTAFFLPAIIPSCHGTKNPMPCAVWTLLPTHSDLAMPRVLTQRYAQGRASLHQPLPGPGRLMLAGSCGCRGTSRRGWQTSLGIPASSPPSGTGCSTGEPMLCSSMNC